MPVLVISGHVQFFSSLLVEIMTSEVGYDICFKLINAMITSLLAQGMLHNVATIFTLPDRGEEYCDQLICQSVCLCVFLSACLQACLWNHETNLHEILCADPCGHSSVLL